jgi:hypothetical protein
MNEATYFHLNFDREMINASHGDRKCSEICATYRSDTISLQCQVTYHQSDTSLLECQVRYIISMIPVC